ncbi:MAG: gfo/Idh/MocA family oxidoreductase, partial [Pseudomonadota bacterium]
YRDLAETLIATRDGRDPDPAISLFPRAEDGLRSIAAIHAAVASAGQQGAWVDARPMIFR